MNPPHNDDYLHTQLHGYQTEETAPAHHLPFDRPSPAEPARGAAGEFGEYMPQADLAGTAADTGGETPASDPAADGDDEDAHVAHAADVEVQRAVADETQRHGDEREEEATGVEVRRGEGEPGETHAYEGHAADVEVPRAVVNETHAHGVDLYEEPAGDAHVHDAAVSEWQVDQASVAEADVPGAVVDEMGARSAQSSDEPGIDAEVEADTSESSMSGREAADVEVQLAVADERDVHAADTYQEPAGDAEVHDAVASEAPGYGENATGEEEHQAVAGEVHAQGEPATDEVSERDTRGDPVADVDVYQAVASDADTRAEHSREEYAPKGSTAGHEAHHAAGEEATTEAHEEPAPSAGEQHRAGDEHRGEALLHEEHIHADHTADHTDEGRVDDESALLDHEGAAGVDAEQHVENEDEEQAASWMQAGPPDAMMEESDVMVATHAAPDTPHDDATGASESLGANGAATAEQTLSMASSHAAVHPAVTEHISSAGDARGMLEGVAQSLRTLAGRDAKGEGIAIFPRGVDVLEVRMHISRDRDIDLNFRVAGPAVSSASI